MKKKTNKCDRWENFHEIMQTSLSKAFRCLYFHLGLVFKIPNKVIFQNTQNTHRIKSLFPDKDRLNRSQMSKVGYKASCWDCLDFYISKTKLKPHGDCMTEKLNTSRQSPVLTVIYQLLQNSSLQLLTIWNGTILTF